VATFDAATVEFSDFPTYEPNFAHVLYTQKDAPSMTRVTDPADPKRCKGSKKVGQCWNVALTGSDYCHGCGRGENEAALEHQRKQYHLTEARYRTRLAQLAGHDDVKSLRDEIALARLLIEHKLNSVKDDTDLINASGQLNTLLLTVERLVKSANSIEQSLGVLLARDTVLRLGQSICEILADELKDVPGHEEIIERVTDRLIGTISETNNSLVQQAALPGT
jgi:hypothetical protein